jgi:hypothetical protein
MLLIADLLAGSLPADGKAMVRLGRGTIKMQSRPGHGTSLLVRTVVAGTRGDRHDQPPPQTG